MRAAVVRFRREDTSEHEWGIAIYNDDDIFLKLIDGSGEIVPIPVHSFIERPDKGSFTLFDPEDYFKSDLKEHDLQFREYKKRITIKYKNENENENEDK